MDLYRYYTKPRSLLYSDQQSMLPWNILRRLENSRDPTQITDQESEILGQDPVYALLYAKLINQRFPPGEAAIAQNPHSSLQYAASVIREPWPPGEAIIAQDPYYSYFYARLVIRGAWPPGEKAIAQKPKTSLDYAHYVLEQPWPPGEAVIATDPSTAYRYATDVIEGPWPAGEAAIAQNPRLNNTYQLWVRTQKKTNPSAV